MGENAKMKQKAKKGQDRTTTLKYNLNNGYNNLNEGY